MTEYRKENHFPFTIEKGFNQFSISTGLSPETELMPLLQEILSACRQNLNFPFRMGIGVSSSKERSRYYAEHALMESNRYGRNDAFFMEEEGKLLGPLSQKLKLLTDYSNPKALQFAKEQGIHESNILKLISLFENDPEQALSAQYIAELLAITPRSASRILAKLFQLKLIRQGQLEEGESMKEKKKMRHGRPAFHFHFEKEAFQKTFITE